MKLVFAPGPRFMRYLVCLLGFTPALICDAADNYQPPPLEAFFSPPNVGNPLLSPDGRHLAYALHEKDEDHALSILDLDTMKPARYGTESGTTVPLLWLDNKGIVNFAQAGKISSRAGGYGLFDIKGRRNVMLNFYTNITLIGRRLDPPGTLNVYFGDQSHGFSVRGLAIVNPRRINPNVSGQRNDNYNLVSRIDLPPGEYRSAETDWRGALRLVTSYDRSVRKLVYYYRTTETAPWSRLDLDAHDDTFIDFAVDPDLIYIAHCANSDPAAALYTYSVSRRALVERVLAHDQFSMDFARVLHDQRDGRVLGYRYLADLTVTQWIDPELQQVQQDIDRQLPGLTNTITSYDDALGRFCVTSSADRVAPRLLLYTRATGKLALIDEIHPQLSATPLAQVKPISYKARDGLRIPAYLTLPPAPRTDGKKPPLIVLCHGGPWLRNDASFDAQAQFLASRGYVVFQPNFRGSSGLSRAVSIDHRYDFKAMHEDVTDGVKALKQSGLIDPDRVAIMGGSFGGYQAVAGAAFEPDLYKCAVTIVGVFDWADIISQRSADRFDRFNYDFLIDKLGDPKKQPEKFNAISPMQHTQAIRIPIYISAGEYDPTVNVSQSKQLADKLRSEGKVVEEFIVGTEGHGYYLLKNQFRLYREIEAFLAKYL